MNHEVYICCSDEDRKITKQVCEIFELNNITYWIASGDGISDENSMQNRIDAINSAEKIVLILSRKAQESGKVLTDVDIAFSNLKPVIIFNVDNCSLNEEFRFFLAASPEINAGSNFHEALVLLVHGLKGDSYTPYVPDSFKPPQPKGMAKPKASFSTKALKYRSTPPYIYLSYDDADLEFIASQIQQYKSMGVNFKHQIDSKIHDSSLLVVFISKDSCKSSKIKGDISKAISNDVGILMIHLDDAEPDFGRIFNLKYGSKFKNAVKYSIYKSELDELAYLDKCDEIFQLVGVKKIT